MADVLREISNLHQEDRRTIIDLETDKQNLEVRLARTNQSFHIQGQLEDEIKEYSKKYCFLKI